MYNCVHASMLNDPCFCVRECTCMYAYVYALVYLRDKVASQEFLLTAELLPATHALHYSRHAPHLRTDVCPTCADESTNRCISADTYE
jgi:hypothetical protein